MRVHVHTKFCFLCVLTFLFHQCSHCHEDGHHQHNGHHDGDHDHAHNDLQISQAPYMRGATLSPGSESTPGDSLEVEQQFYIKQLFRRYGQKDRLDFHDFQSLLLSLGLGEVKMVGTEHEDLGHDHVAHLDLLDVQKGLHSHLPTHDDHEHGHGHGHPHQKSNSHHHHHHPHTEQSPTHCSQQATDASPTADSGPLKEHDHIHDHDHDHGHVHDADHKHDKTKEQDHDNKHYHGPDSDHTHGHHDHDHDHAHEREHKHEQDQRDLPSHPHDNHEHDHPHQTQTSTDIPPTHPEQTPLAPAEPSQAPLEQQPEAAAPAPDAYTVMPSAAPTPPTNSRPKRPRKPGRGQRGRNKTPSPLSPPPPVEHDHSDHDHDHDHTHKHSHDHDHGHGHSHKDKREAPGGPVSPTLPGPILPVHPEHQHEECLNLTQLLNSYGLSSESLISPSQFAYLCPALLYQIDSRVCIRHYHQMDVEQEALEHVTSAWVWLWGFVSITIISLLSLLGVVLVPILNQGCFKFLLTFLVALAVGTLSGDALLHLLPHSQGQHDHSDQGEESKESEDWLVAFDGVWKGLTALAGIYLLFIIEHCIGMFKHFKDQGGSVCGRKKRSEEAKIGRKLSDHKLNRRSDAEWLDLKPLADGPDSSVISCDNGHNDTQLTELHPPDSPTNKTPLAPTDPQHNSQVPVKDNGRKAKRHGHGHGHSHGGNCHSDQEMKDAGIASIAWMVIMGDGMHNFSDGLAIGAAFSANITGGISTSVAVFCHELPHELGDFAVLLKAGMSVKQAIAYNLLSALMAYVGMVIGIAVGQYTHSLTSWIFAITAGMFLYVALVDMLPEMLHGDSEEHKRCQLGHFVLQNLGMLTGFAIMLLIAIFEDHIVLDFGF